MNAEIIKTETGTFALFINGELHREYKRKFSAQSRLNVLRERELAAAAEAGAATHANADAASSPPTSNTGGLNSAEFCVGSEVGSVVSSKAISEVNTQYLMIDGKLKEIPLRCGVGTAAHIDTLTITMRQDVFVEPNLPIDDLHPENIAQLAQKISSTLHTIFGFGISEQKNGINGYKYSFRMSAANANYGVVAFGGANQKDSVMIYLFGEGLTAAKSGWETAFYNWLQVFAPFATITRVDLAHDFLNGEFTPEMAKQSWIEGGFTQRHTRPRAREHGYDWLDERHPQELPENDGTQANSILPNRSGKTFYVGTPQSSRMVRVYEKGCELGDKSSNWTRFELQLRNRDYVIPHEVLIKPGEFLTGAYPVCHELFLKFDQNISKAERVQKMEMITLEHVLRYASQAASPCINMLEQLGFDDTEIKTLLKGGKFKLPKRLGAEKFDCREAEEIYVHERIKFIANQHNAVVKQYMDQLREQEEQEKRDTYFEKMYGSAQKILLRKRIFANQYDYF